MNIEREVREMHRLLDLKESTAQSHSLIERELANQYRDKRSATMREIKRLLDEHFPGEGNNGVLLIDGDHALVKYRYGNSRPYYGSFPVKDLREEQDDN